MQMCTACFLLHRQMPINWAKSHVTVLKTEYANDQLFRYGDDSFDYSNEP